MGVKLTYFHWIVMYDVIFALMHNFGANSLMLWAHATVRIVMLIISVAGFILVFRKTRTPWWYAFIPLLNEFEIFRLAGKSVRYWEYLLLSVLVIITSAYSMNDDGDIRGTVGLICLILAMALSVVLIWIYVRVRMDLAAAFGRSRWFALGMIVLPSIFTLILGLSKAEYRGPAAGEMEEDEED